MQFSTLVKSTAFKNEFLVSNINVAQHNEGDDTFVFVDGCQPFSLGKGRCLPCSSSGKCFRSVKIGGSASLEKRLGRTIWRKL